MKSTPLVIHSAVFLSLLLNGPASIAGGDLCRRSIYIALANAIQHASHLEIRTQNLFESPDIASAPLAVRQKAALRILAALPENESDLQISAVASAKLQSYTDVPELAATQHAHLAADPSIARRDALEFCLTTFRDAVHGDGSLRRAAIDTLATDPASDISTVEQLLPIARGADIVTAQDYQAADRAIQQIHERLGLSVADLYLTSRAGDSNVAHELKGARIEDIKLIEEAGISTEVHRNKVYIVRLHLSDGQTVRAVFKPALDESDFNETDPNLIQFTREVHAFRFFHQYFSHAQVDLPGTFETLLRFNGKSYGVGSLQLFVGGMNTLNNWYLPGNPAKHMLDNYRAFELQERDPRWNELAPRIQAYDFALYNLDRFRSRVSYGNPNNILMGETAGADSPLAVALIDSANGRRPPEPHTILGPRDLPPLRTIPSDVVRSMRSFNDSSLQRLRTQASAELSPEGVDVFIKQLQIEHDYVTISNPFFRPEAKYLNEDGLRWHALNILRSEASEVPDVRLREIAAEKIGHFPTPPHEESFTRWLSDSSPADRVRYALEYILSSFTSAAFDGELRDKVIEQLAKANDTGAAEVLAPIAAGTSSVSRHEKTAAKRAIGALASPGPAELPGITHSLQGTSPEQFRSRLGQLRTSLDKEENGFGIPHPRVIQPNLPQELQTLRIRVERLKSRVNPTELAPFEKELANLERLSTLATLATQDH